MKKKGHIVVHRGLGLARIIRSEDEQEEEDYYTLLFIFSPSCSCHYLINSFH
eukprot:m.150841 g.150841  ORF g.150841 m.150841 type:complete len:52 (+) comp13286_c0_seq1:4528-4683(+)